MLSLGKRSKLSFIIDLPQHFVLSVLDGSIYRWNVDFRDDQGELTFLIILLESHKEDLVMECPFCGKIESEVIDSRLTPERTAIRRRRKCSGCAGRFTTYESTPEPPTATRGSPTHSCGSEHRPPASPVEFPKGNPIQQGQSLRRDTFSRSG